MKRRKCFKVGKEKKGTNERTNEGMKGWRNWGKERKGGKKGYGRTKINIISIVLESLEEETERK